MRVDNNGILGTFAGNGISSAIVSIIDEGGLALQSVLTPDALTGNALGNIYISDYTRVSTGGHGGK
jgi:hypothetical protein